jgi:hypothetical protein
MRQDALGAWAICGVTDHQTPIDAQIERLIAGPMNLRPEPHRFNAQGVDDLTARLHLRNGAEHSGGGKCGGTLGHHSRRLGSCLENMYLVAKLRTPVGHQTAHQPAASDSDFHGWIGRS